MSTLRYLKFGNNYNKLVSQRCIRGCDPITDPIIYRIDRIGYCARCVKVLRLNGEGLPHIRTKMKTPMLKRSKFSHETAIQKFIVKDLSN